MRVLAAAVFMVGNAASADCVVLGDMGYVLPLDLPYELFGSEQDVTLDFTAAGLPFSQVSFFKFPALDSFEPTLPNSKSLPNGLTLHYSTAVTPLQANSAPLATLSGWLEGEVRLSVSCMSQQEDPVPDWCLPILEKLRPEADGCEKNED